jgi:hypothetical protein
MTFQDYLEEREKIANKLKLDSPEKIETAFEYYKQLHMAEEIRKNKIESRATLIIAGSAIMMGLVTLSISIIAYCGYYIQILLFIMILIGFILVIIFVFNSISYALNISKMKGDIFKVPGSFVAYDLSHPEMVNIKKSFAIDYAYLANKYREINDQRETFLNTSQDSLKNAIIVLTISASILVINILYYKIIY